MKRLLPVLGGLLGALLIAGLAVLVLGGHGGKPAARPASAATGTFGAPHGSYTITLPPGWKMVAHGGDSTVLARTDHRGAVVIRARGPLTRSYPALVRDLDRRLRARLADFRPTGAHVTRVGTGNGLVYTFVRPKAGRLQGIVVAPAGAKASYVLDMVAPGGAPDVARQLAAMIRSFTPRAQVAP